MLFLLTSSIQIIYVSTKRISKGTDLLKEKWRSSESHTGLPMLLMHVLKDFLI